MKNSPFQIIMRDFCEWWARPALTCDRFGCAMDAAFKVSDYLAETYSSYPLDYHAGLGGAGAIIEESPELAEYLDSLSLDQLVNVARTIGRYIEQLKKAGFSY